MSNRRPTKAQDPAHSWSTFALLLFFCRFCGQFSFLVVKPFLHNNFLLFLWLCVALFANKFRLGFVRAVKLITRIVCVCCQLIYRWCVFVAKAQSTHRISSFRFHTLIKNENEYHLQSNDTAVLCFIFAFLAFDIVNDCPFMRMCTCTCSRGAVFFFTSNAM